MIRQNVLLSNANKSNVYNLNNDITLNFPTNLFFKAPQYIELLNLDLNSEIILFGNSNNSLYITYKNIKYLIVIEYKDAIKTDYQLAQAVKKALNNPRNINNPNVFISYPDNLNFDVKESSIENVITNYKIERESFTTAYTITCDYPCIIDFNHKDSAGPILGFGNGTYYNVTEIAGTSTQSITAYNYIDVINASGSTPNGEPASPFPNFSDVNCKLVLFNSDKIIIPNKYKKQDTTISLNFGTSTKQYENIGEVLGLIEDQLNDYSDEFDPPANFVVSFDNINRKINIKNTTSAKFGLGFDFSNITRDRIMYSNNGTDWNKITSASNNDWMSVAWGNINNDDVLVAVSSNGLNDRIMISKNNISNWESVQSPADHYWTSIVWSPELELFCAVAASGNYNRVMTSPDGFNWSLQITPNNDWRSITWGNNMFVAVASSGTGDRIMTSTDGINWISRTSTYDNYWTSVIWSADLELFCAVAAYGNSYRIMTSNNGINWIARMATDNFEWRSITWGNGKFIAVASSGDDKRVMLSYDGITWHKHSVASNNYWTSVTWSPVNKFVAVASDKTYNRIMYSNDGITWTSIPKSPINIDWNCIIWAGGNINSLVSVGSSFGNSSGSLHYILGLEQTSYYDLNFLDSTTDLLCYDQIFADD